jgi:hypothetical protein
MLRHEAPAPIGQKAQPAAAGRSLKTAEAVNRGARDLNPRPSGRHHFCAGVLGELIASSTALQGASMR